MFPFLVKHMNGKREMLSRSLVNGGGRSYANTPSSALLLEGDSATLLLLEDRPDDSRSRPEDSVNPRLLRLLLLLDRSRSPSSPVRVRRSDDSLVLLFALLADEDDW